MGKLRISDGIDVHYGSITAKGGIDGLTNTSGISGSNFNITGVNQLSINDPGEGIVWTNGASGNITLAVTDDSSDNILELTGTGRKFKIGEAVLGEHAVHTGYYGLWNTDASATDTQQYLIISAGTDTYVNGDNVYIRAGNNSTSNELKVTTSGATIGGNTVWHAGNDGASSGLDADKLDGQQNTQFFRSLTGGTGSSINSYTDNGFRTLSYTGYSSILWSNNQGGSTGTVQLEFEYNTPARGFKVRNKTDNSTWSSTGWVAMTTSNQGHINGTIWHSGNDGSGTGLDADKVDGVHASSLLRSDADDTFGSTSANRYIRFNCNSGQYIASGGTSSRFPIEIFAPTANGGDAGIAFHISGDYAGFFGLASDWNDLAWGGWSVGSSTKYRILHTGNYSSWNRDDRYYTESESDGRFTSKDHIRSLGTQAFTGTATTAGLISEMEGDGAFDSYSSVFKTSWSYAGNFNLSDAGRFTETAGTSFLTWTDNSSDSTRGNITVLAIAPNTGGSAGKMFVYNDQGSSYAPGWREIWTNTSDGAGSGLDADLLDGMDTKSATGAAGSNQILRTHSNGYLYMQNWIDVGGAGIYSTSSSGNGAHLYPNTASDYGAWRMNGTRGGWNGITFDPTNVTLMANADRIGFYNDADNEWMIDCNRNGNVDLYSNGTRRLNTSGSGINIVGGITSTGSWSYTNGSYGTQTIGYYYGAAYWYNSALSYYVGSVTAPTTTQNKFYVRGAISVGSATASSTWGRIDASNDIVAYSSDKRLKENILPINGALDKISKLSGFTYNWNEKAKEEAAFNTEERLVGVFAQDVQEVLPEAVKIAPFDNDGDDNSKSGENYLTVQYEKIVPLLIEGIKEQQAQIDELTTILEQLTKQLKNGNNI